ncbi:hypothetical protein PTMSG1_09646 [Pyrenophora teres f. maculata]|nr:hypothetical protein PTMSG1_09646 [Pyrenophora teres f. maculata]
MCLIFCMTHPGTARSHFLAPYHCDFVSTDCKVGYHKYDLQEPFSHCASCAMLHGLDLDPDSRPVTYYPPTEHFDIEYVGGSGYERVVKREGAGCDGDGEAEAEAEVVARVEAVVGIEGEKEGDGEVDEEEEEYCGSMRSWGSLSDVDSVTSHWRLDDQISQVAPWYYAYQYATLSPPANYQGAPVFPAYGNQDPAFYPTQDHHHSPQQHQEPAFSLLPNQLGGAVFPTHGIQNQAFYAQHTPHHSPPKHQGPAFPPPQNPQGGPVLPVYGNQDTSFYPANGSRHHSPQKYQEPAFSLPPNHPHQHTLPAHQGPTYPRHPNHQSGPNFPVYSNQVPSSYMTHTPQHSPPKQQEPTFSTPRSHTNSAPLFPNQNPPFLPPTQQTRTPHHSPRKHASPRKPHHEPSSPNATIHRNLVFTQLAQLSHRITESRQNSPPKLQPAVFNTTAPAFRFPEAAGQGQGVGGTGGAGMFAGLYTPPPAPSQPLDAGLYAPSAYTSPVRGGGGGGGGGVGVFQGPQTQVQAHTQNSSGNTTNASITPVFTFNTGVRYTVGFPTPISLPRENY